MELGYITQTCTSLSQKFSEVSLDESECTIYRVYEHLRNKSDKAYDPEIIAIGPYHRDKDKLKMMEDHKLRCFYRLLQRKNENADGYVLAIGQLVKKAHKCYANPIDLGTPQFIEMLILDGCFIIELALERLRDPIFCMDWVRSSLKRDLILFENQIPFFVLCKLFDLIEVPNDHNRLMRILIKCCMPLGPKIMGSSRRSPHQIKHLLDLIHMNLISSFDWSLLGNGKGGLTIASATSLQEANVKFKENEGCSLFHIKFEQGTLYLPQLNIEDSTESNLRNLIAYEQYFCDIETRRLTNFVAFFDFLINSSRDVEILSHARIIHNWLGDDEVIADIFKTIGDSLAADDYVYGTILGKVNEHCNKRRNKWMAKLRREYLSSPWAVISVIAAVVLLLLTVVQTVFSILQVVYKL